MSDDLPSPTPKKSGDEKTGDKIASGEHNDNPDEKFKLTQLEWGGFFGDIFVILWVWSDIIACHDFNRLVFLFSALVVAHGVLCLFISKIFNSRRLALIIWILLCVPAAWIACRNSRPEPKPHFSISLQIGDAPTSIMVLTNEGFFRPSFANVLNLTNGDAIFNGVSEESIVIPTQTAESNKVFNFIAENDSSVKVNDLQIAVGFPKDWEIGFDPTKWNREGGFHLTIPGWRLDAANLQFWGAESPWPMFSTDSLTFPPITNFSIPKFNNPTNKTGILFLMVRSTGFERLIVANVIFIRTPSNAFRPFVTAMQKTNGIWRPSISPKEFDESQK